MTAPRNRRHILVGAAPQPEPFTPHPRRITPQAFTRPSDRPQHAAALRSALEAADTEAVELRQQTPLAVEGSHPGRYIEFEGPPGVDLKIDSLDLRGSGIEVVNVHPRREGDQTEFAQRAVVFIPDGRLSEFLTRFEQYATELTAKGQPKNKELVDRIAAVRLATLRQLWTDDPAAYPNEEASVWWEVWLRRTGRRACALLGLLHSIRYSVGPATIGVRRPRRLPRSGQCRAARTSTRCRRRPGGVASSQDRHRLLR